MKKGWIILIVVALLGIVAYSTVKGTFNNLVAYDEETSNAWANVQSQYQRRADLIPNLVNTVKGFAQQEQDVLIGVTEARSKASSMQINPENLNEANMQQFQEAQGQLSSALSRLMVVVERYPELKSNQNFLELQAQLEGTENRIAVARDRYNEQVKRFNTYKRQFPNNMLAGMFNFDNKVAFQADQSAQNAPTVDFGTN
ncbi:MAG: LemA family protein [Cyclobacteriaceae bacterium]